MLQKTWRWVLGMIYVVAVAVIWIAASFVVQSVVDSGVSPFLITYICNTLFIVYIPIVEIGGLSKGLFRRLWPRHADGELPTDKSELKGCETENLLEGAPPDASVVVTDEQDMEKDQITTSHDDVCVNETNTTRYEKLNLVEGGTVTTDEFPRLWTRKETACASLLICPVWFLAQFTFNLSLKYTTVTSNTILSSTSSLFTFLMSLKFLQEKFTWLKLFSVLLCMAGTVIVSFSDSETSSSTATNPAWGDVLCIASAIFYAVYTTLIRKKLPDESKGEGRASTALFLGFLGLFNGLLLFPIALVLHFTGVEPFTRLTAVQFGLIIGKGLLDNVLSDYLWAKAVLLTSTTAATAGLTIQVPIAAAIDLIRGVKLGVLEYIGGAAILAGFYGINKSDGFGSTPEGGDSQEGEVLDPAVSKEAVAT